MAILQKYGVSFAIATFSEQKAIFIRQIEKLFIEAGLIEEMVVLSTPKVVDMWLRKGEWLLTQTLR
jgi:hypothetical protein